MITCTGCGLTKNPEQFAYKNKATGRRHARCRECVSAYNRTHHELVKDRVNPRTARRAHEHKKEVREQVRAYLKGRACGSCERAKSPLIVVVDPALTDGRRFSQLTANGWPWHRL